MKCLLVFQDESKAVECYESVVEAESMVTCYGFTGWIVKDNGSGEIIRSYQNGVRVSSLED